VSRRRHTRLSHRGATTLSRTHLLSAERRSFPARAYRKGTRLLVLAYPNTYHVAMSNLGFQAMRRLVETQPGWRVERLFVDTWARREGPRTLESGLAPASADVLAFSLSCETDAPALAGLLARSGLAVLAAERCEGDPVVLVGGAAPSLNPEPLADIADAILLGEGELAFPDLLDRLADDGPKRDALRSAAEVESVYVPALHAVAEGPSGLVYPVRVAGGEPLHVPRACAGPIDPLPTASDILTPHTEFADVRLVEIARGCSRGCGFCIVPWAYGRARFRSADSVLDLAGADGRVGLLGAGAADHPELLRIVEALADAGRQVTLSASRADVLSEECIGALAHAGQRTLTLAPESTDESVRRRIGKPLDLDRVIQVARTAIDAGFLAVKLYFMLGLPVADETEDASLIAFVKEVSRAVRGARVVVSAGPFVPKPHTPLEREPYADTAALRQAMARLDRGLRQLGHGVEPRLGSLRYAAMEAGLSRGDRRLGRALAVMAGRGTDGPSAWSAALLEAGVDEAALLRGPGDAPGPLPWKVVSGLPRERSQAGGHEPDEPER